MTIGEVARVLRGRHRLETERLETTRALNHELAGLVAIAFHAPKKMPKYKPLGQPKVPDRKPTERDHALIRAHLMSFVKGTSDGR